MAGKLERELRKIPQYTRNMRHLKGFIRHTTFSKTINLMIVELEWRLRRQIVWGSPYILIVDPTNVCNLRCPLCPTGTGEIGRKPEMMSFERFKKIIDNLAPYLYEVNLHNWGEPLLNADLFKMIEYAHSKNIGTNMSTNLNTPRETDIDNLARSSLEYLIVSLDGTTDDVYKKYRRRGDFNLVMSNLRELVEIRKSLNRKTPVIEWQFIVMKHNIHQVEDARRIAKEIGVDFVRFIPVALPFAAKDKAELKHEWFPKIEGSGNEGESWKRQFLQKPQKSACFFLYRSLTVDPNGRVAPCCTVYGEGHEFGDILKQSPKEIWNNANYQSARSLFSGNGQTVVNTICEQCNIFERVVHRTTLKDKIIRVLNIVIAATIFVLSLPIMALIALMIKIDSPGPAIFRQTRVGMDRRNGNFASGKEEQSFQDRRTADQGGKPFTFYKFRTMYVDARERFPELYKYDYTPEEIKRLQFKISDDPRLTRFGEHLRKTTLDELPNLVNVIRGDMNLVGPRPDIPEMVKYYEQWQREKFTVQPGVTGLAQINGRGLLSFKKTLEIDVEYVNKKSFIMDIKILFKTIKITIMRIGAF
ncbi:MAG: sugar transferase [Promethearchaeota archaeon]